MSAILLEDVSVNLGSRTVLREVNLKVAPGAFVCVVGPNGAGKTTMLRAILGLVRCQGSVRIGGQPVSRGYRQLGYVPQSHEFAWDFPLSVRDVVMSGRTKQIGWFRSPGRRDHQLVTEALQLTDMEALADRTAGQLSGGQKQRVLIARALVTSPRVLLLDEPFTGLDVPTQELLTQLFHRLSDQGVTIVMTTHDLVHAMDHADRVVLVNGTVVAQGRPDELRDVALWQDVFGLGSASNLAAGLRLESLC